MAYTTLMFEANLLVQWPDPGNAQRGELAAMAYKLRQAYLRGIPDPQAHNLAKNDPAQVALLASIPSLQTAFDSIDSP
jgi:hypothetical protein